MVAMSYFVMPYTENSKNDFEFLLPQRRIIQWQAEGKQLKQGQIPLWAGQWTLFGNSAPEQDPVEAAALVLFADQTGTDLVETSASFKIHKFRDPDDYTLFTVVYAKLDAKALQDLQDTVDRNLDERIPRCGVLLKTERVPGKDVRDRFHKIEAPKNGWQKFMITNYYGGKTPGILNTQQDVVMAQIVKRTQMPPTWFIRAADHITGFLTD